jgi:hypothetical protein
MRRRKEKKEGEEGKNEEEGKNYNINVIDGCKGVDGNK